MSFYSFIIPSIWNYSFTASLQCLLHYAANKASAVNSQLHTYIFIDRYETDAGRFRQDVLRLNTRR